MLKQLRLVVFVLCAAQTSQAQLHVIPKTWPSRSTLKYDGIKVFRDSLVSLERIRLSYLRTYSPSSPKIHEIEAQIRQTRAALKRFSSPETFDKEKARRKVIEGAIQRLVLERNSLLRTHKPNSPLIGALEKLIRQQREEQLSDPYTRGKAELLSS